MVAKVSRKESEIVVDVRDDLREGIEPFAAIMAALRDTPPDHAFVLLTTFRPEPLIALLGDQGFQCDAEELLGGEWRVTFRRA